MLEKLDTCQNDPKKFFAEQKARHTSSGYSWVMCCSFDKLKNKQSYYRGKNCMEMFCKDLKNLAMKIINYEKKEMIPLTNEETESYKKQKVCHICKKEFSTDKKNCKVGDHCRYSGKFRGAAHNNFNLTYRIPKEILTVFRNGSTYDYLFVIKQLTIVFKGRFDCLGENTEKYITLSALIYEKMIMIKQSYTN